MKRTLILATAVAASAAALASSASAMGSYCSPSGDVCVGVLKTKNGAILLMISTAAHYFDRYALCVRGPKSRICRSFPIRATGDGGYGSTVSWKKNFPDQGRGLYRVAWSASAKTLTFTR